jgi:hypothetical protein
VVALGACRHSRRAYLVLAESVERRPCCGWARSSHTLDLGHRFMVAARSAGADGAAGADRRRGPPPVADVFSVARLFGSEGE